MRRAEGCYLHWCPGCEEVHPLPDNWSFDGNLEAPTFNPSFRRTLPHHDTGITDVCHYFLHAGQLQFLSDCTHKLAGQTVPLPSFQEGPR